MSDADRIAAAVEACPHVVGLAGGVLGEVATYLPGRSVAGVVEHDDDVEVHVVVAWGVPLPEVADDVRRAVVPLAGGRQVTVVIDDLAVDLAAADGPRAET